MQRLHRSTLWRRKRSKALGKAKKSGRKREGGAKDSREVVLLHYAAGYTYNKATMSQRTVEEIFDDLCFTGFPAPICAIAAWDTCRPVWRSRAGDTPLRSVSPSAKKNRIRSAAKKLVARYKAEYASGLSFADATKLVDCALKNNEPWIDEILTPDRGETEHALPSGVACPSRELEISRRMISYWRGKFQYRECCKLIEAMIRERGEVVVMQPRRTSTHY